MLSSALRRNTAANALGQAAAILIQLAMVPVYLRWMGLEAYGVLGLFITLQAAVLVLDVGMSSTVNRELARSTDDASRERAARVVRSFEWVVWSAALALVLLGAALAPGVATHWLNPQQLSGREVTMGLLLLVATAAAMWPTALYGGVLAGLQRQVLLNVVNTVFLALRAVGVLLPLALAEATLPVFFGWQLALTLLHAVVLAVLCWARLPAVPVGFDPGAVRSVLGFAGAVAGIGLLSFIVVQADRIILSRMLPLDALGRYAVAAAAAAALHRIMMPLMSATYPRFSELHGSAALNDLRTLYRRSVQLATALVVPASLLLAAYAGDVLRLWTGDRALAVAAAPLLSLLALGFGLNALTAQPLALLLAHGRPDINLRLLLVGTISLLPCMLWAASVWGAVGAAAAWLIYNMFHLAGMVALVPTMEGASHARTWWSDTWPPAAAALAVVLLMRLGVPVLPEGAAGLLVLLSMALATLGAAALTVPFARNQVRGLMRRLSGR